ncbi:MAG: type II toxin-antitoxin system mRNA interferase toxin, RelE/StbE family [Candidatus Sungbacteria bacterium]|nr:type II toxin-antitoxin system mRNA interferase toxin, RelE/StbE family [Candidatus Sungbacteria bacterium]
MVKEIRTVPYFDRRYRKLPLKVKKKAKEKENIFRNNPFDSRLHTHKLHGENENSWAFWIDYTYRIKFVFLAKEEVLFLDIGTHDMYK